MQCSIRQMWDRFRACSFCFVSLRRLFLGVTLVTFLALTLPAQIQPVPEPARILVLANSNDPQSLQLAQYYAQKRAIPSSNILALPLNAQETIDWDGYVTSLHNPLLEICLERGWVRGVPSSELDELGRQHLLVAVPAVDYLVCMRGVPVRIKARQVEENAHIKSEPNKQPANAAAVDSELALLFASGQRALEGAVPNPYFQTVNPKQSDASRLIGVARLDGPTVQGVVRMIDRTLEAETQGLIGRAYFDLGGPYQQGDQWLEAAMETVQAMDYDLEVERSKRVFDFEFRLDAPAIYMGWYRSRAYGPWLQAGRRAPAGAIGFHLHSFSANSLRKPQHGWLAALLAQGYCASVGNVYEPYLHLTHRPDLLLDYLQQGYCWGAAVRLSLPALSWMGVAVGDPLYCPFKISPEAQAKHESLHPYQLLQSINRVQRTDGPTAALQRARKYFWQSPSLVLALKLAQLHAQAGDSAAVVSALKPVDFLNSFMVEERAVVRQVARLALQHGAADQALRLYQQLIASPDLAKKFRVKLLTEGQKIAHQQSEWALASQWLQALNALKVK